MSRRSTEHGTDLTTIDRGALGQVIGGRITPRTTLDPVLLEGIQQLAQAIMSVGQSLASAKQGSTQQMMQLFQQLMEKRGGG